tara:strand:- start:1523 stop:2128 length:606 start_codon:yes stop_codon:yes gene_type:complete
MKQTQLDIGTIGQKLKATREAKKISVSEAGSQTRILSKFISAMEEDNFQALSAPVYVKSFIRLYAKYLELDPKPLIEAYIKEYEEDSVPILSDDTKRNLAEIDASISSDGEDEPAKISAESIFSLWTKSTSSWISNNSLLSKKILQYVIGAGFIIILLLLARCGTQSEEIKNVNVLNSFNSISDAVPNLFLNEKEDIEWTR